MSSIRHSSHKLPVLPSWLLAMFDYSYNWYACLISSLYCFCRVFTIHNWFSPSPFFIRYFCTNIYMGLFNFDSLTEKPYPWSTVFLSFCLLNRRCTLNVWKIMILKINVLLFVKCIKVKTNDILSTYSIQHIIFLYICNIQFSEWISSSILKMKFFIHFTEIW